MFQVLVGGRDDANIDTDHVLATYTTELALLEDPKGFGLGGQRHLPDLVEKDGPLIRQLEEPTSRIDCTRERSLFVSEKLAFQECLGEGGNVHGDERSMAPRREVMDSSCDQLLAGSRFTGDQHRGPYRRKLHHTLQGLFDRVGFADDARQGLQPAALDERTRHENDVIRVSSVREYFHVIGSQAGDRISVFHDREGRGLGIGVCAPDQSLG